MLAACERAAETSEPPATSAPPPASVTSVASPPSAAPAAADASTDSALSVACDPKQGVLVLFDAKVPAPDAELREARALAKPLRPGDPAFDCEFGPKRGARIKLGALPALPHGQCGADPERFVSIWLDRVKLISEKGYAGRCLYDDTPLAYVRVSSSGVRWCTASALSGELRADKGLKCTETPRPTRLATIDTDEYPRQRRPAVGSILIDHAENRALCEAMIAGSKALDGGATPAIEPPPNSQRYLLRSVGHETEAFCELFRGRFDFDNDRKPDDVVLRRCRSGTFDADQYFVAPRLPKLPAETGVKELKRLRDGARLLVPESWATERVEFQGQLYRVRALQHVAKERENFRAASSSARHKRLRIDFLHLEPFRYQDVTYLLSAPPEASVAEKDTFVLFRPQPRGLPVEACVFHQVQENF